MTEVQRLAAAITKISEVYLTRVVAKGDKAAIAMWSLRLADYSTRLAVLVSPPLKVAEAVELDVPEPLSSDPSVAIHQLLAATGHPVKIVNGETFSVDPSAVLADATPEQAGLLALAMPGFFGYDTTTPGIDWSLFLSNYERTEDGWQPTAAYIAAGGWAGYLAGAK